MKSLRLRGSVAEGAILVGLPSLPATMISSENVPHDSFGTWADPPGKGQLEVGFHYQASEAYYFWDADRRYQSDYHMNGEHYGIDINQGCRE